MTDYAETYRALRGRVSDLVRDADEEQLERLAPAAPEWRVRDLVAHLSGITADINAGNLDGVATDAWTARQVDTRRDWSIDRVLDEWDTEGAKVEAVMSSLPEIAVAQMTMDAATHEHDIRGALDRPGGRDTEAMDVGFDFGVQVLAGTVDQADATLRIETGAGSRTIGSGARQIGVRADRFELVRAMTGRRSVDQMRGYDWDGEALPELLVLPIFTPRPAPLVE
jgi:uncharacterized protein (TIGR03083 family)